MYKYIGLVSNMRGLVGSVPVGFLHDRPNITRPVFFNLPKAVVCSNAFQAVGLRE
jgi:hypothetical protein